MFEQIRLFHLLSVLERKHRIFELDSSCRALLDIVVQRELSGITTVAEDLMEGSDMSRATVYRKIHSLKQNGALVEMWLDQKLTYGVGANVRDFCSEINSLSNG